MKSFSRCFRDQLPFSLLIYPCIPCVGDTTNILTLFLISSLCLLGFFLLKFLLRNSASAIQYLNGDYWVPIYFLLFQGVALSLGVAAMLIRKRRRKKEKRYLSILTNSFGLGILYLLGGVASLKVYDLVDQFPVIGPLMAKVQELLGRFLGENTTKVVSSWWGIAISMLLILIPAIGPFLGALLLLIPQQFIIIWFGYLLLCAIYS
jgi:hypothetical protein